MQPELAKTGKIRFELPGSKPHYPPSYPYTVDYIHLKIEPDLRTGTIVGEEAITIRALAEIKSIELDSVELEVDSIVEKTTSRKLAYHSRNDKLAIDLGRKLGPNEVLICVISYTAKPRKGFYFIRPDSSYPRKRIEAWTQGETNEARHWFPSIDHPQVKFRIDLDIVAPTGFQVVSNGIQVGLQKANKKTIHRWSQRTPIPAYLLSVVVGKYKSRKEDTNLFYYTPKDVKEEDRQRTFSKTPDMMKFFTNYFGTPYPFEKYSQVTVQDFLAQGMENAGCTTLTLDTIHDKRVEIDYSSENLVSHELAHQWFGDLVTCKDWQDLWLNESFATYCEALYQENSKGKESFHQLMIEYAETYFEEASSRYIRPIVTNVYKHPDDLFDTHSYAKGACVINMLRHMIGDEDFKKSIKKYFENFGYSTADTHDLRKVFERVSGKNLQQFFDQWLFKAGHPEIEVEFSTEGGNSIIRIRQVTPADPFNFELDIRLAFRSGDEKMLKVVVLEKDTSIMVPNEGKEVEWFSVDPEFRTLVKIMSIKAPWELFANQLKNDKTTIVERVQAARALKCYSSQFVVNELKSAIISDKFWFVGVEAAKSLGTIKEEYAYKALRDCLTKVTDPRVKRAIVGALGEFRRKELVNLLRPILASKTESSGVQSEVATAIGKTKEPFAVQILRKSTQRPAYLDLVAQGAIAGLQEFVGNNSIAKFILEKSRYGNRPKIREAATLALGKFAAGNEAITCHLRNNLLRDKWFRVRKNACKALAEAEITDAIPNLQWVADHDIDAGVRRIADECIIILREIADIAKRKAIRAAIEPSARAEEEAEEKLRKTRHMVHLLFLNKMDSEKGLDR